MGGKIASLDIVDPDDIMHILSPYTQHLTELTLDGKLRSILASLLNGISTHNPMLENVNVRCALTPEELLPLVSNLPKHGNLVKVILSFDIKF